MDKMPCPIEVDVMPAPHQSRTAATTGWREMLPILGTGQVVLRELRASDAPSLFALLTTEEVARFISQPPASVEGFEQFIAWAGRQRTAGACACFAVTLRGFDTAIGIFQVRQTTSGFATAEWGFAINSAFWGTGVFQAGAEMVMKFAFDTLGVRRLEARSATLNGRGNRALQKVGGVQECVLRKSFRCGGKVLDQALYAIIDVDWRAAHEARPSSISYAPIEAWQPRLHATPMRPGPAMSRPRPAVGRRAAL